MARGRPRKVPNATTVRAMEEAERLVVAPRFETAEEFFADLPAPEYRIEVEPDPYEEPPVYVPSDWRKGALLNVRNYGEHYIITLWPEEYSPEREDRCVKFTNVGECQDWVSQWYDRQSHDPRAR